MIKNKFFIFFLVIIFVSGCIIADKFDLITIIIRNKSNDSISILIKGKGQDEIKYYIDPNDEEHYNKSVKNRTIKPSAAIEYIRIYRKDGTEIINLSSEVIDDKLIFYDEHKLGIRYLFEVIN